jgi:hypothetical protein
MQIRVGIPSQGVSLASLGRLHESPFGNQRDDVEMDPPQRRCQADSEDRRHEYRRGEVDLGTSPARHDRLAQSEDDHEVVPFGKVTRDQSPLGDAEGRRKERSRS